MSFETILQQVSKTKDVVMQDDSVRSISGASLVSGIIPISGAGVAPRQTQRISAAGDQGYQTGSNQSDRAQVPADTLNKVPRVYGSCVTGGVVVDAHKIDANTVMYCFVLSDMQADRYDYYNQSSSTYDPAFTLGYIYRDNDYCTFSATSGNEDQVITLTNLLDSTTKNTSSGNIRVWAWAGSSANTDQIFPNNSPNNALYNVNAYDVFPTWDSNVTMDNLVFAIVQMHKDEALDLTQFGSWAFSLESQGYVDEDLASSTYRRLTNPGWALHDYLLSDRYGLGLSNADIDYDSLTDWASYCSETDYYASDVVAAGGSGATFPDSSSGYVNPHNRFRIDGFLNTQSTVLENIERICSAGMATFNYDHKQGKFKVLYNKKMSADEKANAFLFNSENIVSSIQLNTSDIFSLYDFAEVTFPNYLQADQPDTIIVQVPTADRFVNEVTATTTFSLDVVSDRPRAARIANISLKLSRIGTVVQLTGDHSTMVVDVGDFVKVTDELKGWDEKYFRVMRIRETENNGIITCTFTLSEYSSDPFEEIIYYDTIDSAFAEGFGTVLNWNDPDVGNLSFYNKYTSFTPVIQRPTIYDGLYVYDNPITDIGRIINPDTGNIINSNVSIASAPISIQNSPDLDNESWLLIRTGLNLTVDEPEFSNVIITLEDVSTGHSSELFQDFAAQSVGTYTGFPINKLHKSGTHRFKVKYVRAIIDPNVSTSSQVAQIPVQYSQTYTSANFTITDQTVQGNGFINTYGTNSQIVDTLANAQYAPVINDQIFNMTNKTHDVIDHKSGTWTLDITFKQGYDATSFGGSEYLRVAPRIKLLFVNNIDLQTEDFYINASGAEYQYGQLVNWPQVIGKLNSSSVDFTMDPDFYGLDETWYCSRATVEMLVYANSLANVAVYDVDYTITNQDTYYRDR